MITVPFLSFPLLWTLHYWLIAVLVWCINRTYPSKPTPPSVHILTQKPIFSINFQTGNPAESRQKYHLIWFRMPPQVSPLCSCGQKLKSGTALAQHLRYSPRHNKSHIEGNAATKPVNSKTKLEGLTLVRNTPTSYVVFTHPATSSLRPIAD